MELTLTLNGTAWRLDPEPADLAIPLYFNGPQPNTYGVDRAAGRAFEGGGFVGDVRRGGSCNFEQYTLVPHCNGTHTEGLGHLTAERIPVHPLLRRDLFPATLVSVQPRSAAETRDRYRPALNPEDRVIDREGLLAAWAEDPDWSEALILRTLPNGPDKCSRDYMQEAPPFFTLEAMQLIRSRGVAHLLTDLPSVDRLFDEGRLSAHRIFWELEDGRPPAPAALARTITEFIYAPDALPDGRYLLNLQLAPFMADAAPSRPRVYRVHPAEIK